MNIREITRELKMASDRYDRMVENLKKINELREVFNYLTVDYVGTTKKLIEAIEDALD